MGIDWICMCGICIYIYICFILYNNAYIKSVWVLQAWIVIDHIKITTIYISIYLHVTLYVISYITDKNILYTWKDILF